MAEPVARASDLNAKTREVLCPEEDRGYLETPPGSAVGRMGGKCWGNWRSHPVIQADEGRSLGSEGEGRQTLQRQSLQNLLICGTWGSGGHRVSAILTLKQLFGWCCCRLVVKRGVETRIQGISGMLTRNALWLAVELCRCSR